LYHLARSRSLPVTTFLAVAEAVQEDGRPVEPLQLGAGESPARKFFVGVRENNDYQERGAREASAEAKMW
jgi:hypothetical protein